jgi:ankyrin repeat protein
VPCNAGATPLHLAALRGHAAFAALLLSAYADGGAGAGQRDPRGAADAYGATPADAAAGAGRAELARLLSRRRPLAELAGEARGGGGSSGDEGGGGA